MSIEAVVICSGGMDSVTAAYVARALLHLDGDQMLLVGFDYGQKHVKELDAMLQIAKHELDAHARVVDLSLLGPLLPSALTDVNVRVPHGHYADENMRATVVPNRNAIMLSIAWGIAVAQDASSLWTGVHAGDHPIYPDCRPAFVWAFDAALRIATDGHASPLLSLRAPFLHRSKAEIVKTGHDLRVPYELTWSCYEGGAVHCGRCGTCVERREAFELAGVTDPTQYLGIGSALAETS